MSDPNDRLSIPSPMEQVLEDLIAKAPADNEGSVEVQLHFEQGGVQGAVRRTDKPGVYLCTSVSPRIDPTSGRPVPGELVRFDCYFLGADVLRIAVPMPIEKTMVQSGGKLWTPSAS